MPARHFAVLVPTQTVSHSGAVSRSDPSPRLGTAKFYWQRDRYRRCLSHTLILDMRFEPGGLAGARGPGSTPVRIYLICIFLEKEIEEVLYGGRRAAQPYRLRQRRVHLYCPIDGSQRSQ